MWGIGQEAQYVVDGGGPRYTISTTDGTRLRPLDGPPGTIPGAVNQHDGTQYRHLQDVRWDAAAALQGPNEPDNARPFYPEGIGCCANCSAGVGGEERAQDDAGDARPAVDQLRHRPN